MDTNLASSPDSFFNKLNNFDPFSVFTKFFKFINDLFSSTSQYATIWTTLKNILGALAVFFIFVIAYVFVRLIELRRKEAEHLALEIKNYKEKYKEIEENKRNLSKNPRWAQVIESFNQGENGWRLAILEADSILNDMLTELNFSGDSLGEKLKLINFDNYPSLRSAWEAHHVRNQIAHEGSNFNITEHETKRILAIYETIFRDFNFI